jgi:ribonuclease III
MARVTDKTAPLQTALGHKFRDKTLLRQALTHSSARGARVDDNERLEFLGDRVLGLAIAELISEMQPEAREGDLARLFNTLVQRGTCAEVAIDVGLGEHLLLSGSELTSGGRTKASILADACEAVLGAVFLDAGFIAARKVVRKLWLPRIEAGSADGVRDPKTALQEWAQGRKKAIPLYVEVERAGPDHAPQFTTEVRIDGAKPARGLGTNKRMAEQDAARVFLERERIWKTDTNND